VENRWRGTAANRAALFGLYKAIVLGVISPRTSSRGKQTAVAITVFSRTGSTEARGVRAKKKSSTREALREEIVMLTSSFPIRIVTMTLRGRSSNP